MPNTDNDHYRHQSRSTDRHELLLSCCGLARFIPTIKPALWSHECLKAEHRHKSSSDRTYTRDHTTKSHPTTRHNAPHSGRCGNRSTNLCTTLGVDRTRPNRRRYAAGLSPRIVGSIRPTTCIWWRGPNARNQTTSRNRRTTNLIRRLRLQTVPEYYSRQRNKLD